MLDIRLTELVTRVEVRFWPAPALVPTASRAVTRRFQPVRGAERVLPISRQARSWTLDHTFPGGRAVGTVFAPAEVWRPPVEIDRDIQRWMDPVQGPPSTVLMTVVSRETPGGPVSEAWPAWRVPVLVDGYSATWGRGDDLTAQLTLTEVIPLLIAVDEAGAAPSTAPSPATRAPAAPGSSPVAGAADAPLSSYTVKEGDTLSRIAALPRVYGDAGKYARLFEANKDPVIPGFTSADAIQAGWVLTVPRQP